MKKMLNLAVMLLGVALFTACEKDDNEDHGSVPVFVNSGVYVVCSGSMSSGINSALTYFEYATKKNTLNIFKDSNGYELGLTANDALRYGSQAEFITVAILENVQRVLFGSIFKIGQGTVNA